MESKDAGKQITLYDKETGMPSVFNIERVFVAPATGQQYCCAWPVHEKGDPVFLRCLFAENKDGEIVEIYVHEIPHDAEYKLAVIAYNEMLEAEAISEARSELVQNEDYITFLDENGNPKDFIIHTIFKGEGADAGRQYIAVTEVDDAGDVGDEVTLYRFDDSGEKAVVDMIPSDMEYQRARRTFISLLDAELTDD